jgi:hypothetical protein
LAWAGRETNHQLLSDFRRKDFVRKPGLTLLLIALFISMGSSLQAANLNILETPNGIVFQGDCNFGCDDWHGLVGMTSRAETGSVTATLFDPRGHGGTFNFNIYDAGGTTLSDTLVITTNPTFGPFTATFCSNDSGGCSALADATAVFEDGAGNFSIPTGVFDPNMSMQGNSLETPEPAALGLLFVGLGSLGFIRRRFVK